MNELSRYFAFGAAGLTINGDPAGGTALESGCRLLTADAHFSQVAGLIVVG